MLRLLPTCFSALSAAAALAQSEGPYMGFPLQFVVAPDTFAAGSTTPVPRQALYAKDAGFTAFATATTARPTDPRFTIGALFGTVPAGFAIDALSTGFHYVFFDSGTGLLDMEGRWGALLFSVTRVANGSAGSQIRSEATRVGGEGAGADLFSMILPGSTLPTPLSCWPIAVPQLATDSSQMGFGLGPAGQKPDMRDFDPYMAMYDDGSPVRDMLPDDPWVYFSLTNESLAIPAVQAHTAAWFVPTAPHGATILRTQWLATASPPHWSTPEVHMSYIDLGLTDPTDEIDAIAVDEARNVLLLSLRRTTVRPTTGHQLMVATWSGSPFTFVTTPAVPYQYSTPTGLQNVADATGIVAGDDIDAVCEEDPGNGAALPLSHGYLTYCGLPFAPSIPSTLEVSAHRGTPAAGTVSSYYVSVAGLGGVTLTAANLVMLVVSLPGPAGIPYSGSASTLFVRPPANLFGYETHRYDVPVLGQGIPWGAQLDFQWAALGATSIAVSPVVRIGI